MLNTACIKDHTIDQVAQALQQQGYLLLSDFLPTELAESLFVEAKNKALSEFKPAAIGRQASAQLAKTIRSDQSLWLSGESDPQQQYLAYMDQLRLGLNRRLFMGLFDFECHFSHYAKGSFYKKHLDAFKPDIASDRSNRVLSTVTYLNPNWQQTDGGELVLYAEQPDKVLLKVPPKFNQCIVFLSDSFPHEVLASQTDRYSIAGWFRVNNNASQCIDPAR
ncbi:2OG-Fe(II) oxygenase [Paraglaciecola aestuariivivens]